MHQVGGVDLAVWTGGRKGSKRPTKLGVLLGHKSFDEFCVFLCVHSQPVCVGVCVCCVVFTNNLQVVFLVFTHLFLTNNTTHVFLRGMVLRRS